MTPPAVTPPPAQNTLKYAELAIPLLSFGVTLFGVLLWNMGILIEFQYFAIGSLVASCILCYLAWIRPRKDIVSLSTPLYAFIFFVVPTDFQAGVTLQLLCAGSLTLLLVRLKRRFGASPDSAVAGNELNTSLNEYVEKTREAVDGISPESAHRAAVAMSRFASGEFAEAARLAGTPGEPVRLVARAFGIVTEHATLLEKEQPRPFAYLTFLPEDDDMLAVPVLPEYSDDRKFDTALDNALLLLFSAAWNGSVTDRPHLVMSQAFMVKLLGA